MPTLGEVCSRLRVSRRTLDKWLDRFSGADHDADPPHPAPPDGGAPIVPQRHPYDLRFFTITDEEVQRIREARAQMPGVVAPSYRPVSLPPLASRSLDAAAHSDMPPKPYTRRERVPGENLGQQPRVRGDDGPTKPHPRPLPDGWVPATTWAKEHGIWETHGRSLDRYVQAERAPEGEPWGSWRINGRMSRWYDVYAAYTPEQQAELAEVARRMWPNDWHD